MIGTSRRLAVATVALCLLVLPLATAALADRGQARGFSINRHAVVHNENGATTAETTYQQIDGMYANITVPRRSYILITFSGESKCVDTAPTSFNSCKINILVNGASSQPVSEPGGDAMSFSFDYGSSSLDQWEAQSMQRVYGPVEEGTHTVNVMFRVSHTDTQFTIRWPVLTIQAFTTT